MTSLIFSVGSYYTSVKIMRHTWLTIWLSLLPISTLRLVVGGGGRSLALAPPLGDGAAAPPKGGSESVSAPLEGLAPSLVGVTGKGGGGEWSPNGLCSPELSSNWMGKKDTSRVSLDL